MPTKIPPSSTIDIDIFTCAIRQAQISSLISKNLSSVSAFRQTTAEMIETIRSLDQKLHDWRDQLPPDLQIKSPTFPPTPYGSRNMANINHLHFAYYGSLLGIHMVLTYPWIAAIFSTDQVQAFREQVSISTETVAQAARSIILMTRQLNVDVASPAWYGSPALSKFESHTNHDEACLLLSHVWADQPLHLHLKVAYVPHLAV